MASRPIFPVAPPLSPLAEVVLAFEAEDPDACALLLPFSGDLTPDRIEARARSKFPERPAAERAEVIARAVAMLEIATESATKEGEEPHPRSAQLVSAAEKERRCNLLMEALMNNPGMTASEGLKLLDTELEVEIAQGSFYSGYWQCVLDRLPPATRRLREEMTAWRPGKGALRLSAVQRTRVRKCVAEIKRDHPEYHHGQIMDEVRKLTLVGFRDPVAFRRHYVDTTDPASPLSVQETLPTYAARVQAPVPLRSIDDASSAIAPEVCSSHRDAAGEQESPSTAASAVQFLLAVADPLKPAELLQGENGHLQVKVNLRPTGVVHSYQLMSQLYAEMARLAAAGPENERFPGYQ